MRSKYLAIILFQLATINQVASGQIIVRSSMSCLGSTVSDNGFFIRQTIGQSPNTNVFSREGLVLRQGFQQPLVSYNPKKAILPIDFTLSPNPAGDKTLLEFKEEISRYLITIRNIDGILLSEIKDESLQSKLLDLTNIMQGIYIITVTCDNRLGSKKLVVIH